MSIPTRIHFLNSNLNNTKVSDKQNEVSKYNNRVNFKKLENLLKRKYNSNITNTKFKGVGNNGEYFIFEADNNKYVCKCMPYTVSNLKQIQKELSILHKIQSNKHNLKYINPCLASFINNDNIINIFPIFKGITLRKLYSLISTPDFDKESRYIISKYIIKQLCKALYQIHKLGISHRQLDLDSVVIELPPNLDKTFHNENNEGLLNSLKNMLFSDDKKISKIHPTKNNYETYKPILSENDLPLKVKITNFGYGCGKTLVSKNDNSIKLENVKIHSNVNCSREKLLNNDDPFITNILMGTKDKLTQKEISTLGYKYDLWCLGLIILHFILSNPSNLNRILGSKLQELTTEDLVDDKHFKFYLDNTKKYLLVPIDKREDSKFVEEKISLDEKYD
jgi:serine/threonine protein kinase